MPQSVRHSAIPALPRAPKRLHVRSQEADAEIAERAERLAAKIEDKSAIVAVVGLGYVGLPFAVEKAKAGFRVVGVDRDPEKAAKVNAAENYIGDVDDDEFHGLVRTGRLQAVSDFSNAADWDVIVIAVPTPLTKNLTPDLRFIESVSHDLAKYLRRGQLISLESTTYPGTTDEVMRPILESTGLKADADFYLCHSPERVDPGNKRFNTKNTNKVVGGVGPESQRLAMAFYAATIEQVVPVSSARAAEMVKVYENTFRAVNVGLVNEFSQLCDRMGLNVWEVLDAAFTKPFGIMPFYPGPGVGGHCIPLDPHYLEWKAKEYDFRTHFIALAGEVNRSQPAFVREKAYRILNTLGLAASRSRILVLGVSYKRNVGDYRESPAVEIIRMLQADGADVQYHDPYVPEFEEHGVTMQGVALTDDVLRRADLTMVLCNHACFDYGWILTHARHVLDCHNAMKALPEREKITLL